MKISVMEIVPETRSLSAEERKVEWARLEQIGVKLENAALKRTEREELMDLLIDNKDLFATDMSQLVDCSSLPPFEIHIKNQRPLRQRCYRQTPEAKAEIRRQVDALQKNGLVEPTQSLWNSPILFLRKANGSYRMCIDFRKVNEVTFPQYQPLVSVTELVDVFGERKPKIFTTLDMFSGYHQVKMAEDSKNIRASPPQMVNI